MNKCKFHKRYTCSSENQTETDCLYCIIQQIYRNLSGLLGRIDFSVKIPLGEAVIMYRMMHKLDENYIELMGWINEYRPDFKVNEPIINLAEKFREEAKRTPVV